MKIRYNVLYIVKFLQQIYKGYQFREDRKVMATKTNADVIIGGKVYTLSGYENEAYLHRVASYINNKMNELDELSDYRRLPVDMKATLLELNIADDYFKAKNQAEKLEEDLNARNKEIYDLKHELISIQIKLETLQKSLEK